MNKRYQVFISSTYADLKEERSKVIQTIMELDCIPAGMEIFPAIDEEQFNFIKKVIDDCDYYLLIIGGRYGSISEDGLSYTEKEYDYAMEKGIKVIAFIHGNPDAIPFGKSEKDAILREKLELFKSKVSTGRLVKFWNSSEDLPGLVALSLSRTIKTYPAIGWVRANLAGNVEILQELNDQRKANEELKAKIGVYEKQRDEQNKLTIENLAGLKDSIEIKGSYTSKERYAGTQSWSTKVTWEHLFSLISPYLIENPNDSIAESHLTQALFNELDRNGYNPHMDAQIYQTIKLQLKLLGLIDLQYLKTVQGNMSLFWMLTDKGKKFMYELRAVKKDK